MPSAKKDRVTISLHLDKRLYALLKRCSEFEKLPMSRIVDKVLEPYVEKYESATLEDMEAIDSYMKQERAEIEQQEMYDSMEEQVEDRLESLARQIHQLEENHQRHGMPKKLLDQFLDYVDSETTKSDKAQIEQLKLKGKAQSQRWLDIVEKYPLPDGINAVITKSFGK